MMQAEPGEVRPSVLLVDEVGRLPGHSNTWLAQGRNWQARRAETLVEAVQCLAFEPADAVLLALADQEDRDCAATLRMIRLLQPAIIVGVVLEGPPGEEARWLDAGADFVTSLPFELEQAAARLRAALRLQAAAFKRGMDRRVTPPATPPREPLIALGASYRFNPAAGLVMDRELRALTLTPHELAVLRTLAQSLNQLLSRDEICRTAFGRPWTYGDRSVDRTIMSLRQRLDLDPARGPIRSQRSAGYVLLSREDGQVGS